MAKDGMVFLLCGAAGAREFLTAGSQCDGIAPGGIDTYYQAVFFHEKPKDFLVWDIEKTLADPHVASTDNSFEYEPLYESYAHDKPRGFELSEEP